MTLNPMIQKRFQEFSTFFVDNFVCNLDGSRRKACCALLRDRLPGFGAVPPAYMNQRLSAHSAAHVAALHLPRPGAAHFRFLGISQAPRGKFRRKKARDGA